MDNDFPVFALPIEFYLPDIERYTGIGAPVFIYSCTMLSCAGID